jgi:hypothetical protein
MQSKLFHLTTFAATTLLVACGGGGGGGSGISNPPAAGNPSTAIVSTAAPVASSYSGEELAAFNAFNIARNGCGFGVLLQNAAIDRAALNHVGWMVANNSFSHSEIAATPGFTGVDLGARLSAAGYAGWVSYGEVLTAQTGGSKTGFGLFGARTLLSAPYHLMGLMQGNREIGISVKSSGPLGSGADITSATTRLWFAADMAANSSLVPQAQGAADVLTYPCQGVTNTARQLTNESPNPIPARDLALNPIGQPVFVQLLAGRTLVINTATMATTAGNIPVANAAILTAATDPNAELTGNQAIIIPNTPLAANTQYTVTLQGSNNGTAFQKIFTFSTGS